MGDDNNILHFKKKHSTKSPALDEMLTARYGEDDYRILPPIRWYFIDGEPVLQQLHVKLDDGKMYWIDTPLFKPKTKQ